MMVKAVATLLFVLAVGCTPFVNANQSVGLSPFGEKETIHERIVNQKRWVVYSSRRLTGECLPICVPEGGNAPEVEAPTPGPTTSKPTDSPTALPTTSKPTNAPTNMPTTSKPTNAPTNGPTTSKPTSAPTSTPTTSKPTNAPTNGPTTSKPTNAPTSTPTTNKPTSAPTSTPTTSKPTTAPTNAPTTSKPTNAPTNMPTTNRPTTDCEDMLNLGYGFSAATHDSSLGATSHYGQDGKCFPHVQSMGDPPKTNGYDDSVAVLVGGNYVVTNGAELEGNLVVLGNMHIGASGLSNLVSVGVGSQVVPHSGGKCVQVGGNLSSDRRVDVFYGTGSCDVVYKGSGLNVNQFSSARSVLNDPNLDMSVYALHVENLRKKSVYWGSLPSTPSTSTQVQSGRMEIKCSNKAEVQVINIPTSTISSVTDIYVFSQSCLDKTILLNVQGSGDITMPAREMYWVDAQGARQRGGWQNFNTCMNGNILWNFPGATKVTIDGNDEVSGSLLVTGDLIFKTIGQSGRTMVLGNLEQNRGGSEFHSFEFKPPIPLPELDCADFTPAPPISSSYECVWPANTMDFTLITKNDATSAAHNMYTKIAVGGTFYDGAPNQHTAVDGMFYYGNLAQPYAINFNKGQQQIADLSVVPLDFNHFEWLARNIKPGTYGTKKVFVMTEGTTGTGEGGCYTLFDFVNGGQANTGVEYLVVFNTNDEICLTKTSDGRQFGPSILAPFSHVELKGEAGYIDGTVIAKSFSTCGSNAGQLQLHGKMYSGTIECPPSGATVDVIPISTGICDCDNTNSPIAYSWKCGTDVYYCENKITSICSQSLQSGPRLVPLNDAQCAEMNNKKLGETCLKVGPVTQAKGLSHKVCYSPLNPLTGYKYDGSCDACQSFVNVGTSSSNPTPRPPTGRGRPGEISYTSGEVNIPSGPTPTKNPTPNPTTGSGAGCCSQDFKTCINDPGWCGTTQAGCNSCGQNWLPNGPFDNCIAKWGTCTNDINGCCGWLTCQGGEWYKQCL